MLKRRLSILLTLIMMAGSSLFVSAIAKTPDYSVVWNVIQNGQTFKQTMYFQGDTKIRTEMQNPAGSFTTIARMDKKMVWVLMDAQKTYMPQAMDAKQWEQYQKGSDYYRKKGKKVGSGKVLNYDCDIYQFAEAQMNFKAWVSKQDGISLRTIMFQGGKELLRMEVTKLTMGKQPDSLFELPKGYKKAAMPNQSGN